MLKYIKMKLAREGFCKKAFFKCNVASCNASFLLLVRIKIKSRRLLFINRRIE
jgi:hypothetical protein